MKKVFIPALFVIVAALLAGCGTGGSRGVDDCIDCNSGEYCVLGLDGLYCANPCVSHLSCTVDHWCVPLVDQDTLDRTRWVCMPEDYYRDSGSVYRSSCGEFDGAECPIDMSCVEDADEYDVYYCADACYTNSDCLTDCCAEALGGESFCAPFFPYCG
jgi:hypothetical protein